MAGMMMKMAGISVPSVPTPGGSDDSDGMTMEEKKEAQQQKMDELAKAERARAAKYKKERAVRDGARDNIREKYNIEKKPREEDEEEEDEEDDDGFGAQKKAEIEDDPVAKAKAMAEEKLQGAKKMMSGMKFW